MMHQGRECGRDEAITRLSGPVEGAWGARDAGKMGGVSAHMNVVYLLEIFLAEGGKW